jgi:hypothetical protein
MTKRITFLFAAVGVLAFTAASSASPPPPGVPQAFDAITDQYGVTNAIDSGGLSLTTPSYEAGWWCRTATARRDRTNLFGINVYHYYERLYWCWSGGVIRYAYRDRWGTTNIPLWSWDGNVATNCQLEHCNNRGVSSTNAQVWTEGQFHACLGALGINYCEYKYPQVTIYYNGSGGASASTGG